MSGLDSPRGPLYHWGLDKASCYLPPGHQIYTVISCGLPAGYEIFSPQEYGPVGAGYLIYYLLLSLMNIFCININAYILH
jgi:hypothetical protein